ncbi:MAG TPA: NADH-quinone oxidoreductase subunit N [Dehalococcoidia bacterium]|jgi:NADH-quinone oxidoreductase subunit N|nr:NADH-quinone oxidoreductase subunit N [Dehalococcoidia bacterium]
MSAHDLYVISPYLGVAGTALLVILLDLVVTKKGLLPIFAILGLLAPLALTLIQAFDLNDSLNLVKGSELLATSEPSVLLGSLSVDRFAIFFNFLVLAAAALVIMSSTDYLRQMDQYQGEYYGLILFSATGMMLLSAATELITIYIAVELTTMPLVALAAFMNSAKSSEAGMKFFIVGAISSALMLYGMALIYGFTGTTIISEIAASVGNASGDIPFGNYALLVGLVLLLVGFGFKISSVPFQMWVPDVYEGGPTPVIAFLSVASKAAAFAILLRVFFSGFFDVSLDWAALMAALAAASMVIGNLVAVSQSNIKRLFGYSAIAHAGYILVGVAAGVKVTGADSNIPEFASIGPDSVLFYLAAYTAANLTAFFAITAIGMRIGSDRIEDYAGVARRSPVLAAILALSLAALLGVPPTSIFIAKLYIFTAAVNADLVWLAILGVITSVVSAYYYVRIIRVMFLQTSTTAERISAPPASWAALAIAGGAMLFIGIAPGFVLELSKAAVGPLTP